jgi:hypothetical protein
LFGKNRLKNRDKTETSSTTAPSATNTKPPATATPSVATTTDPPATTTPSVATNPPATMKSTTPPQFSKIKLRIMMFIRILSVLF